MKNITKIEKTRIWPLRVIGNFCGEYAGNHLIKAINLDEQIDNDLSFRYKYHAKMWVILNKPYERWGTYYLVDTSSWLDQIIKDVSGQNWDDYDKDGIAYWEKE